MNHFKLYCQIATSSHIMMRALKVSLVVGSILNIINQGDTLANLDFANVNFVKFLLTFAVPYGVTTYTAVALKLEFHIGSKSTIEADLECKGCKESIHIKEHEIIPECDTCGIKTRWKLK